MLPLGSAEGGKVDSDEECEGTLPPDVPGCPEAPPLKPPAGPHSFQISLHLGAVNFVADVCSLVSCLSAFDFLAELLRESPLL